MKSFISKLAREEFAFTFESYSRMLSSSVDFSEGQKLSTGGTGWKVTSDVTNNQLTNGLYAKPITKVYVRDFGYTLDIAQPFRDAISVLSGISGSITFDGIGEAEQFTEVVETVSDNMFIDGADCVITCSAGFLDLTQSTDYKRINVKGLVLQAGGAGAGDALKLTFPSVGSNQFRTAKIIDVNIEQDPDYADTNYFTSGITLTNAWKHLIADCNIKGAGTSTSMSYCINIAGQSTDGETRNTYGYFADNGFLSNGTSEGLKVIGSFFIYVNNGIVNTPTSKIPAFYLTDVHVNTLEVGIYTDNVDQQEWKGLLVYGRETAITGWVGVKMNDCANCQSTLLTIAGSNITLEKNAIELYGSTNNNFDGVTFVQPRGKVVEDDTCSSNMYTSFKVQGDLDTSRAYIESTRSSGKSYFNSYQKISTTFRLNSDQSIPDTTWTDIVFSTANEAYSETGLGFYDGSDLTNATQPIYVGAARFKAWVTFDGNVSGIRQIRITDDTGVSIYSTMSGSPDGNGELHVEAPTLNLSAGSKVKVQVRQSSGAALNITDAFLTADAV